MNHHLDTILTYTSLTGLVLAVIVVLLAGGTGYTGQLMPEINLIQPNLYPCGG